MHARAGDRLIDVKQVFALAEAIQKDGHRADVQPVRAQPQQVVQQAGDLVEHHANVLCALRHFDAEQLFNRHHVGVLVGHHRHVVEAVHVRHRLQECLVLGEFLGRAMQQSDVRVSAFDDFAVQLQHQSQHAVGRRMLRPEVHRVIFDFSHLKQFSHREHRGHRAKARNIPVFRFSLCSLCPLWQTFFRKIFQLSPCGTLRSPRNCLRARCAA